MSNRVDCGLCGHDFDVTEIVPHLIDEHDQGPLETWPDGEPVIIDATLEPEDFRPR